MNKTKQELMNFIDELEITMKMVEGTPTSYFYNKLHEETGEVAEVASAFMGSLKKQIKLVEKCGSVEAALIEELSDSFVVIMILARRHGFDLEDIFRVGKDKMFKVNMTRRESSSHVT